MTDSPLDLKVKRGVLTDALKILNLSFKRKQNYIASAKQDMQNRLMGIKRLSIEERELMRQKLLAEKDSYELKRCGGYERIYPLQEKQI